MSAITEVTKEAKQYAEAFELGLPVEAMDEDYLRKLLVIAYAAGVSKGLDVAMVSIDRHAAKGVAR